MRVLVCGGRGFANFEKGYWALSEFCSSASVIIHGCAAGADRMADQWARENKIEVERYPAEWSKYGSMAGSIRNQQMLRDGRPLFVLALPGGSGTRDMIHRAIKSSTPVVEIV